MERFVWYLGYWYQGHDPLCLSSDTSLFDTYGKKQRWNTVEIAILWYDNYLSKTITSHTSRHNSRGMISVPVFGVGLDQSVVIHLVKRHCSSIEWSLQTRFSSPKHMSLDTHKKKGNHLVCRCSLWRKVGWLPRPSLTRQHTIRRASIHKAIEKAPWEDPRPGGRDHHVSTIDITSHPWSVQNNCSRYSGLNRLGLSHNSAGFFVEKHPT